VKENIKPPFDVALKDWLIENGYIGKDWRFKVKSKKIIEKSDFANIYCEVFKPRKRKPFFIEFLYNFVREQIRTDTIQVNE
jgi:hypothetical protein